MRRARGPGLLAGLLAVAVAPAGAQETPPVPPGREAVEALEFPPLRFDPPESDLHEVRGVEVLHLEDRTLPLVDVYARFRGGPSHFPRAWHAAASGLTSLVRDGGSASLPPDSIDVFMETFAVQTTFGGGGGAQFAAFNVLISQLDTALAVWGDLLKRPRFDSARVEVWRGRELDQVRRREDDPTGLAFSTFNHLMYGDHPVGWIMTEDELEPEDLARARLDSIHARVYCRENMVLGVSGDVSWEEARPRLDALLADWPACPDTLPETPEPDIRTGGGVFLIPRDLEQSTIVMAHATDVHTADDPDFFASRIGNTILGGGGFQSRLLTRVRSDEGLAYSASSLWTAPRKHRGVVGAVTRTRADRTVRATRLVLDVIESMTEAPPSPEEVETVVADYVNGFVFNFESPSQIVSRRMVYESEGLPADWLERYLDGVRGVSPENVHRVFREHVRPDDMVILVVGDPDAFDEDLSALGPVTVLTPASPPSGSPRSRR